jgi:hypothetical protein
MDLSTYQKMSTENQMTTKASQTYLKSIVLNTLAVIVLASFAAAAELPEAPSTVIRMGSPMTAAMTPSVTAPAPKLEKTNPVDLKFVSLALISSGSAFADSYTTLFAQQNWQAGKSGVCNAEVDSAYLYGTHPTVGRTYAIATAKSAGSIVAAYYLRKHHSKFWSLPLIANSVTSLGGVAQNMPACN